MDIYEEITRLRREGRRGALATIINVRGSIPSFESAKMLVRDDGTIVGQAFHPDTQASPAFMATPRSGQESEEPGNVQEIQTP